MAAVKKPEAAGSIYRCHIDNHIAVLIISIVNKYEFQDKN